VVLAQIPGQSGGGRHHWVRRFEPLIVLVCSVFFAVMGGVSIAWLFSTLNFLGTYQLILTVLAGVSFTLFGFTQSRGLASRMQQKEPFGFALWGVIFYEFVEVSACFFEAAHGVRTMVWLSDFDGVMHNIFYILLLIVLSVLPIFSVFCGQLDVRLHHERYGVLTSQGSGVPVYQPPAQPRSAGLPLVYAGSPAGPGVPVYQPPAQPRSAGLPLVYAGSPAGPGVPVYQPPAQPRSAGLPPVYAGSPAGPGVPVYQPPAQPEPAGSRQDVVTDALGEEQEPGEKIAVTGQEMGGRRVSRNPLLGRRRRVQA